MSTATPEPYDLASGPASRLVGVSQSTLTRWAERHEVAAIKTPGGHWRFRRVDLEAFLDARRLVAARAS